MPMIYYEVKRAAFISDAIAENFEEASGIARENLLQDLILIMHLILCLTLSSTVFQSLISLKIHI